MLAHHGAWAPARPRVRVDARMFRRGLAGPPLRGAGDLAATPERGADVPVLLAEAVDALAIRPRGLYVDATFGGGSYSRAILAAQPGTRVLALDRDPEAFESGAELAARSAGRLTFLQGRFGDLAAIAQAHGFGRIDG